MEEQEQQKDIQDYIVAVRKRKTAIFSIFSVVLLLTVSIAFLLPAIYRSSSTILIEQQEIPPELVMSTVTSYAAERIQTIQARVMSRSNLLKIIDKFKLYEDERKFETTEEIIERMQEDVSLDILSAEVVDPRTGRPSSATIAFTLAFKGESPTTVQRVANELTTLYLNENLTSRAEKASETSVFFKEETERLGKQIDELESKLDVTQSLNMSDTEATPEQTETITNPVRSDPLTKENLVNAGVNEGLAAEIIRRKSELEYKQLELRDRAIRENYMNTPRYFQQLRELNANATSLRDDIGSEAYDRYLYAAGQNNRVVVSSVMSSSPAEQSGLQKGDIILRYDNEKIFNWNEIRQATGQGNRNEYITIDIIRDGQLMNMVLPRGPLGVKLDSTRSNPDN